MSQQELPLPLRVEVRSMSHALVRGAFRGVRGIALSKGARREREAESEGSDKSLTYGEVVSASFELLILECCSLISTANAAGARTFVDLGSGTGKAVITAALGPNSHGFCRCTGIELVSELDCAARTAIGAIASALSVGPATAAPIPKGSKVPPSSVLALLRAEVRVAGLCSESELASRLLNASRHKKAFKQLIASSGHKNFRSFLHSLPAEEGTKEGQVDDEEMRGVEGGIEEGAEGEDEGVADLGAILQKFSPRAVQHAVACTSRVSFVLGSIFDVDWPSSCDFAYCASLLFTDAMMQQLYEQVCRMPTGAVVATLRALPVPAGEESRVERVSESFFAMSWHKALVTIYRVL